MRSRKEGDAQERRHAIWGSAGPPVADRRGKAALLLLLLAHYPDCSTNIWTLHLAMASPACHNGCSRALRSIFTSSRTTGATLPAFLVPALASLPHASHFSTTPQCLSKIGRAPISLPPEVTFTVLQPPPQAGGRVISRSQRGATVQIEGPRGKLSHTIPPYMSILSDAETRTQTLSILDAEERKQREMWGQCCPGMRNSNMES